MSIALLVFFGGQWAIIDRVIVVVYRSIVLCAFVCILLVRLWVVSPKVPILFLRTTSIKKWSWQLLFFWRFPPKARQPLMLLCLLSPVSCPLLTCLQVELLRMRTKATPDLNGPPPKIFSCSFAKIFSETPIRHQRACDVTNRGGVRGGIPPRHSHTYHHHLQKPRRSRFHYPSDS